MQLAAVLITLSLLVPFCDRDQFGDWPRPPHAIITTIGIMLGYMAVSLLWSPIPYHSLYVLSGFTLLAWSACATGYACMRSPAPAQLSAVMVSGYLLLLTLLSLDIFCNYIVHRAWHHLAWDLPVRSAVTTRSVNAMVMLLWPVLFWFVAQRQKTAALLIWLTAGILALFSNTASGRAGFAIGSLLFYLARLPRPWALKITRFVLCGITAGGFVLAIPAVQLLKASGEQENPALNNSFRQRIEIWDFSAQRFAEKPLFGWGFDSARVVPKRDIVSEFEAPTSGIMLHPHNMFLQCLLELGIAGSIPVLLLMWQLLALVRRLAVKLQPYAYASYMAIMVMACFSYGIWQVWWLSGFVLVLYAFALLQARENIEA